MNQPESAPAPVRPQPLGLEDCALLHAAAEQLAKHDGNRIRAERLEHMARQLALAVKSRGEAELELLERRTRLTWPRD